MSDGSDEDVKSKQGLAEERTDFAEDRTVLANERTFASWFRTGFASVAIGLGFQALFLRMEPEWAPKAIATLFLLLAIFIFIAAERRACRVLTRLSTHSVSEFNNNRLRLMVIVATIGVVALIAAMWGLRITPADGF
ncbi:hypothetical protein BH24PSE1_BH24PSE1_10890 [soil metagenome]